MIPVAVVALLPLVAPTPLTVDEQWRWAQERYASGAYNVILDSPETVQPVQRVILPPSIRGSEHGRFEAVVQQQDDPVTALARRNELSQRAKKHYLAGQLDEALDKLSEAIKIDPDCATLWESRGNVWADKKEYSKATDDLDRAFKLEPKSALILCSRGLLLYKRGKLDEAEFDLIAALNLDPKYERAWYTRGVLRAAKCEYELAVADFTQAIELNDKDPDNYVWRGDVRCHQQDWEKAIDDYAKAIELDPKSVLALCRRGNAYIEQQEYDKALSDYNRAIELDPKCAAARTGRGFVRAIRCEYREAIAEYEKAIEHAPKRTDTLYYLTYLYAIGADSHLRDPKKAVTRGKQLVEAAPFAWWAQQALAVAHAEAGDFDAAVTGMRKVLESEDLSHEERESAERYIELFLANKPISSALEE